MDECLSIQHRKWSCSMFMLLPASPFSSPSFHKQRNPLLLLDELSNLPEILFGFQRGKMITRGFNAFSSGLPAFLHVLPPRSQLNDYTDSTCNLPWKCLRERFLSMLSPSLGTEQRRSWYSDDGVNDVADVGCGGLKKMLEGD
jgi:hypothetical protein